MNRTLSRTFGLLFAAALLGASAPAAEAPAESKGSLRLTGLSEKGFNPLRGALLVSVTGAAVSREPGAVEVLVNGVAMPEASISVAGEAIEVEYELVDGLNEVLVTALDRDGALLTGDALVWGGSGVLVVDVVDASLAPVDGATVTVQLAESTIVRQRERTTYGTARFTNLPARNLLVTADHPASGTASAAATGTSGSLMLTLGKPSGPTR